MAHRETEKEKRKLSVIRRQTLGFLSQQTSLESRNLLLQDADQLLVLVALMRELCNLSREGSLDCAQALFECRCVAHEERMQNLAIGVKRLDASRALLGTLALRQTCEQLGQRRDVDVDRGRPRSSCGQLEHSLVQALVQQAESVALYPQHFQPAQAPVREHDQHSRSEEHTSELQSLAYLVCRLLLE